MSEEALVKRPAIARAARPVPAAAALAGLAVLGGAVFLWLSDARAAQAADGQALPPLSVMALAAVQPLPAEPAPTPAQPAPFTPAPQPYFVPVPQAASPAPLMPAPADDGREQARIRAPALIVDLAQLDPAAGAARPGTATLTAAPAPAARPELSDAERFAARVGSEEVEVAQAQRMTGLDRLVPQGAIIGAVMETALNSDLPGFARAIVQRDVLSFDGSAVLIPAGSRVIGQYKSGVARGASRVFIVWTRLIRPDGVSIALASPAIDEIGRGGVAGQVNRHFLQRYGGAILLSVLTGGLNVAAASVGGGGGTIVVGTAGEASALARQAAEDLDIPPTITTPQGASVRIFVAQDLDFTRVGPAA